jgi:ABC-2 type transport system permease protein
MFATILKKEFREQWRTSRLLVLVVVLFISGMISPLLAKYTPALLRSVPDLPAGLADLIPDPTINDAVGQYVKNVGQFGVLLVVILTMGVISQEKERGTAALTLTHPVQRSTLVLAKWLVGMASVALGLLVGGLGCLFYTAILFELLPVGAFLSLNLLLLVFLGVYLSVALLASALARSQSMAAAGAFGGLAVILILSSIPRLGTYFPGQLTAWGTELVLGNAEPAWWALGISFAIIAATLALACWRFEKQEL